MAPIRPIQLRYTVAARRAMLARQAAVAALVVLPGVACTTSDADVFSAAGSTPAELTDPIDTLAPDTDPIDTLAPDTVPAETVDTTTMIPAGAELQVSFSFVPSSGGGRVANPYIAVWVEDLEGNLVQTISVWFEQSGRGARYLSDLPAWYSASGRASDVTMSGATRVAGDYTVAWDGTGLDGELVPQGDYVVFVEAAREHGPYEITSQQVTFGTEAFTVALADDGELANLSATFVV